MFASNRIASGGLLYPGQRLAAHQATAGPLLGQLPLLLTIGGMIASTVALWIYIRVLPAFVRFDTFDFGQVVKPPLFYVAHGLEIFFICAAGLIALTGTDPQILRRYGTKFLLFLLAGALMALRGYSLPEALSTKIFSSSGPFVAVVSLLILVGAQARNWYVLDKVFLWMASIYSAFVLLGILGVQSSTRWESSLALTGFLNVLYWPAAWLLLRPHAERSAANWLRFVPLGVYSLGSVFTQTRLNWIMILSALAGYLYIQRRRRIAVVPKLLVVLAVGLWLVLFSAEYLNDTRYVQTFQASADSFLNRLDEDTRSGQMIAFFTNVETRELLFGRGSLATWTWNGIEWTGGTDIGYLSLLFFGGVPLLLTYIALHIAPAIRAVTKTQSEWQRSCAVIVLLWALRMFSSSYPGIGIEYFPVLLCVGGCLDQAQFPRAQRMTTVP